MNNFATRLFVVAERWWRWSWILPLCLAVWWAVNLYRIEPYLSYENLPFPVLIPSVKPGEPVPLRVIRCNADSKDQIYSIARTMEDITTGRQYVLTDSIVRIRPGCTDETSLANVVPLDVPPGRYRINGLSQIQTQFRIHFVSWTSQTFQVTH